MSEELIDEQPPRGGSWLVTLIFCLLIGGGAAATIYFIFHTQPTASRTTETRRTAMLVEVIKVRRDNYHPEIVATGTVVPSREITLSPEVTGRVTFRSEAFSPGGFVDATNPLVKIDPSDYNNIHAQRIAELEQAKADLDIEMGRQKVAALDLELLGESPAEGSRELILRQPQLKAAKAVIKSAESAVSRAKLDVERCEIKAPFDAQVLERNVDVGSQISPGDVLGRLVGLNTYWIETTVPLGSLPWIEVPEDEKQTGSKAVILDKAAWPANANREGNVQRLIGSLDGRTRLARLLITIDDPLARKPENSGKPRLIIGSLVEATLVGKEIKNVIRLKRELVRDNDTVWLMKEGKLRIAQVTITFRDANYAYISDGIEDGDAVVTTSLSTVAEDAPLRVKGAEE